jgi:homocysteine S-methyltransferase
MRSLPVRTRAAEFRQALQQRVLVADGAMATGLFANGAAPSRPPDELNLKLPALVRDAHREYLRAGAEIVETNTFGANRVRLSPYGLAGRVRAINEAGVRIAREAANDFAYVAGVVGPLGVRLEPLGSLSEEDARVAFVEQVTALVDAGVDLLILETFTDLAELENAVSAVREVAPPELAIVAEVSVEDDGSLADGTPAETVARRLDALSVDVIGLNCCSGPSALLDALEKFAAVTQKPISAMPNAGLPTFENGQAIYHVSPEYFAQFARRYLELGVRIVGGCCGTTADHIHAIREAVSDLKPESRTSFLESGPVSQAVAALEPVAMAQKSKLGAALKEGRFVKMLEVLPPRGVDVSAEIEIAKSAKAEGIEWVSVPDGPRAAPRLSARAMCQLLQEQAGVETVLDFSARERNVLTIQSDLLGAHVANLRNVLCITGDPPRNNAAIAEVDSIGLTRIAGNLNRGLDVGGNALGSQTALLLGVAVNPAAQKLDEEIRRLERKAEAGAEFVVTQPIFDLDSFEAFLRRIEHLKLPVIAGIWPVASYRNAEFLLHELRVPIPEEPLKRMRQADTAEAAHGEGIAIAREMISKLSSMIQGVQLSAPFGRYELALEAIKS